MTRSINHTSTKVATLILICAVVIVSTACSIAPKMKNRPEFIAEARTATAWFEDNVEGLRAQIDDSAGYIVFPAVGKWGIVFTGGKFGRGMLNLPDDSQIGWAAINRSSLGLQAGVQGFKMLIVFQDIATLEKFKKNLLDGSVSGIVVVGKFGGNVTARFSNSIAVYEGANSGLMAGVNFGLNYMRYKPLDK